MVELAAIMIIFGWMVTLYASYNLGHTKGLDRARREFREGFKLVKGGK